MTNKLLPIGLGLSVNSLKGQTDQFKGDTLIEKDHMKRIHERDDHCCQYCGFQAEKFQKINVLDGNWSNLSDDNLVTSCIFCQQCFYIDQVARMRSGVLIWMPEMTQAALNHLIRSIYVARITQGPMADYARKALDSLMKRREEAKERVMTDDPAILSMVLSEYIHPKQYKAARQKLDGVRLMPLDRRVISEGDLEFNQFPQILAFWRSKKGPFGTFMPDSWISEYAKIAS
jgi:intracellular multiplication protein IcmJ